MWSTFIKSDQVFERNLEKLFVSPEVILSIIYNILMSLIYFFDNYFSAKSPSKTKRNQQLRDFD